MTFLACSMGGWGGRGYAEKGGGWGGFQAPALLIVITFKEIGSPF